MNIDAADLYWLARHCESHSFGGTLSFQLCTAELHPQGLRLRVRRKLAEGRVFATDRLESWETCWTLREGPKSYLTRRIAEMLAEIESKIEVGEDAA